MAEDDAAGWMRFQTPEEPAEWESILAHFLRRHLEASGAGGYVVGLSGGVDSAVAAAVAVRAVGAGRVLGLLMPGPTSDPADKEDGLLVAQHLGVDTVERPLAGLVEAFGGLVGDVPSMVRGNAMSRMRMLLLYAEAQRRGRLVLGTGNKSELLVGYFTKYGDGAADVQPLGDLYKTQVWALARHLALPPRIIERVPTAGLLPGQTDEGDLGVPYRDLDRVLKGIELNQDPGLVRERTGLDEAVVAKVYAMVHATEHKRHLGLIPKVGARTVGIDWRRPVQRRPRS
ncbi:MAG TPA: NAD+ synthase [Candidatus Thermoplasmatota archaeon]|nr:NAD+ synthase [Candidatus Thermoplasmatota archaeon]